MDTYKFETDNREVIEKLYRYLRNKNIRCEWYAGRLKEYEIEYRCNSKQAATIDRYIDKIDTL